MCDNYRGISLLSIAGKVLAKVLLNRLSLHLIDEVVPESQCGFRKHRGCADMIFSIRQLQEKCMEQQRDVYVLFIDLTKAFDSVSRKGLWLILSQMGVPQRMVDLIRQFHDGMNAQVIGTEECFPISNVVKQGCVLAPNLFNILFSVMLSSALKDCTAGIPIRYRMDKGLFTKGCFKYKSCTTTALVRDLLYADDAALVAHSEEELQELADRLSQATKKFGLTISTKKTEVLYQPSPTGSNDPPKITIDGVELNTVDSFTYLGSVLSNDGSLDKEIANRNHEGYESLQRARSARMVRERLDKKDKDRRLQGGGLALLTLLQ